jgi:hypothetical protein
MKRFMFRCRKSVTLIALLSFSLALPPTASAKSPVKLTKWSGDIDFSTEGISPFVLSGNASHLGKFTAYGEVAFHPGATAGTFVGDGVVVFTAANGDLLVGNVAWDVDAGEDQFRNSQIHFSWRESVVLSNGEIVSNTGRFIDSRPPGLVVIAIIAILIGMLLPAVQK